MCWLRSWAIRAGQYQNWHCRLKLYWFLAFGFSSFLFSFSCPLSVKTPITRKYCHLLISRWNFEKMCLMRKCQQTLFCKQTSRNHHGQAKLVRIFDTYGIKIHVRCKIIWRIKYVFLVFSLNLKLKLNCHQTNFNIFFLRLDSGFEYIGFFKLIFSNFQNWLFKEFIIFKIDKLKEIVFEIPPLLHSYTHVLNIRRIG